MIVLVEFLLTKEVGKISEAKRSISGGGQTKNIPAEFVIPVFVPVVEKRVGVPVFQNTGGMSKKSGIPVPVPDFKSGIGIQKCQPRRPYKTD